VERTVAVRATIIAAVGDEPIEEKGAPPVKQLAGDESAKKTGLAGGVL
jgi:hypothetical protein